MHLQRGFSTSARRALEDVFIISGARTPVGRFNGVLKTVKATELAVTAMKAAVLRANIADNSIVDSVYLGQVVQAGVGQSPARQVVIGAGLPSSTEATTINKVCASALKAVMLAAQNIQTGQASVMIAGGMESMSNSPFYLPRNQAYGDFTATDSIIHDGLWDVYNDIHMGNCAENTVANFKFTREDQDEFARESYRRARLAQEQGLFRDEIVPVEVAVRGKTVVISEDEQPNSVNLDKLSTLRPVFNKSGSVTAGNASPLNDGASAVVLASESAISNYGLHAPLARIISFADAAREPIDFTIAPSLSVPIALSRAGLQVSDIAKFELNEAFAAVSLANMQLLDLDPSKVNVRGGAVALGHAIGNSGSRILVTLINALKKGEYGVAAICNGGGGSSAIVIQRL